MSLSFLSPLPKLTGVLGTEGRLGGQAQITGVSGIWKELTENVNVMALNLTLQVREIAEVTKAVGQGDLGLKIQRPAQGEILQLQQTSKSQLVQF